MGFFTVRSEHELPLRRNIVEWWALNNGRCLAAASVSDCCDSRIILSVLIMTSELAIDPVPIRGSMRMTCTVLHHYPYRSWVLRKAFPGFDCLVDNDVSSSTKQWNHRGYTSVMHRLQNTISRNLLLWLKTGIIGSRSTIQGQAVIHRVGRRLTKWDALSEVEWILHASAAGLCKHGFPGCVCECDNTPLSTTACRVTLATRYCNTFVTPVWCSTTMIKIRDMTEFWEVRRRIKNGVKFPHGYHHIVASHFVPENN